MGGIDFEIVLYIVICAFIGAIVGEKIKLLIMADVYFASGASGMINKKSFFDIGPEVMRAFLVFGLSLS